MRNILPLALVIGLLAGVLVGGYMNVFNVPVMEWAIELEGAAAAAEAPAGEEEEEATGFLATLETLGAQRIGLVMGLAVLGVVYGAIFTGLFHVVRSGGLFLIPMALGAFGIAGYFDDRRFLANPRPTPMAWWYKHMEAMGGAGIAFHTAFLIFGGQRLFDGALMQGAWSFLPWILPAAIGIPALHLWTRHYKRRFGELPEQAAVPGTRSR